MKIPKSIKRGECVVVHWVDITGSTTGDPDAPELARCTTPGYFYGEVRISGRACLVCTRNLVEGVTGQHYDGYDTYPLSVVDRIERVTK